MRVSLLCAVRNSCQAFVPKAGHFNSHKKSMKHLGDFTAVCHFTLFLGGLQVSGGRGDEVLAATMARNGMDRKKCCLRVETGPDHENFRIPYGRVEILA